MNDETKTLVNILSHRDQVSFLLRELARQLQRRADVHDISKLRLDELEGFCQLGAARNHQKEDFGSRNYETGIKNDAVQLHLSRNSHHPEYHSNGLSDMSFADIIEMLCDWEIARRQRDLEQNIKKTWKVRQQRFNFSDKEIWFLRTIWEKINF